MDHSWAEDRSDCRGGGIGRSEGCSEIEATTQVSGAVLSPDNRITRGIAPEFHRAPVEGWLGTCAATGGAGRAARSAAEVMCDSQKQTTLEPAWLVFESRTSLLSPASGRRPTGSRGRWQYLCTLSFFLRFFA